MQPTQDTERRYHMTIKMDGKRYFNTKHAYTREQAEEISDIAAESARVASKGDSVIIAEPLKVIKE